MKKHWFILSILVIVMGMLGAVSSAAPLAQEPDPPTAQDRDAITGQIGRLGAASNPALPHAQDHVVVQLADINQMDAVAPRGYKHLFDDWYTVAISADETPTQALARLSQEEAVKTVELDYTLHIEPWSPVALASEATSQTAPDFRPNDPYYNLQWHFPPVQAEAAWDRTTGQNVIVAIVDSGVAKGTDLNCRTFVDEFNALTDRSGPGVALDDNGHGTHVAGTVAQCTNNALGVAGLAFDAKLMPVKVLDRQGSGNFSDAAQGIDWARTHGATVANMSFGADCGTNTWPTCSSSVFNTALAAAANAGMVLVAAAGNADEAVVGFPANHPDVMAIGAVDYHLNRAPYSTYGSKLSVVAPGGNTQVDANGDGYVDGVLQQTFENGQWNYYFFQGTSMATPHVAGAVALLRACAPNATRQQIQQALESTAMDRGPAGRDNEYGYGLIQINNAINQLGGCAPAVPPPGDFTEPAPEAQVTARVWLRVQTTNPANVAKVVFTTNGTGAWTFISEDTTPPFEVNWAMYGMPDNQRFLIGAEIHERSGARTDRARWITKRPGGVGDTVAPTGDFTEPAADAVATAPVWLRVQAADDPGGSGIARIVFTTNGTGSWTYIGEDATPPYEIQWNMAGVPDNQPFLIGAEIHDRAGNRTNRVRTIRKAPTGADVTPPTGDFTEPAPNAAVAAPVWLRVQASDNPGGSGIARVRFTTNGTGTWTVIGEDTTPPYEVQWNMAGVPDNQPFLIGAEIHDRAGNRADRVRWISRRSSGADVTPPSGDFTEPAPNAAVTAPVWLRVQASDNPGGSGIARVRFTTNGTGTWTVIGEDTTAPYEVQWNMAGVPENQPFLIGVEIHDRAGNRADRVRWITRIGADTIAPTGDFTEPAPNAAVTAPVWLRVQASDNPGGSGIARVRFTTNGTGTWTVIGEDTTAPYEVQWNMAGVPENQPFLIGAEIHDRAGNRADRVRWITRGTGGGGSIQNGNFEQGAGVGWQEYSARGVYPIVRSRSNLPANRPPHGGDWAAWLGGLHNEISVVYQQVTIPAGASTLRFWYWISSEDVCGYDFGGVVINNATVADRFNLCSSTNTNGWVQRVVNLGAWAGQSVQLQIRSEHDGSLLSSLFVDDVTLGGSALSEDRGSAPAVPAGTPDPAALAKPAPAPALNLEQKAWPRLWPANLAPKP